MSHCLSLQLEESNRTLTVDVANLASEKEELNNKLKELQQGECHSELMSTEQSQFIQKQHFIRSLENVFKSCPVCPGKQEKNAHQK